MLLFFFGNIKKRGIFRLGSSYAVDKLLQGGLDAKNLFIAYVTLKLMDDMDKALEFYWKGK